MKNKEMSLSEFLDELNEQGRVAQITIQNQNQKLSDMDWFWGGVFFSLGVIFGVLCFVFVLKILLSL
jgi:hypothetical protein